MPEDDSNPGVCDLTIDPVMALDEGVYQCQVSPGGGVKGLISSPAKLNVNTKPEKPTILEAKHASGLRISKGDSVELTCESHGGKPFAELSWLDENDNLLNFDVMEKITRVGSSNTFKSVSTVKFTMNDNTMKIKCSAHSDAFPLPTFSDILLLGEHVMEPSEEVIEASEGDTFEIICGDKVNENYQWYVNDNLIIDETKSILKLIDFTKAYDKSIIKCAEIDHDGAYHIKKIIRLKHQNSTRPLPRFEALSKKKSLIGEEVVGFRAPTKKSLFNCVYAGDIDADNQLDNVLHLEKVGSGKSKLFHAWDRHDNKIVCKESSDGWEKLKQLATKSKTFSKTLKGFSKTLTEILGDSKS